MSRVGVDPTIEFSAHALADAPLPFQVSFGRGLDTGT
jgi:hypothetical protein